MNKLLITLIVLLLTIGGVLGFLSERESRAMNEGLITLKAKLDEAAVTTEKVKVAVVKVTQERDTAKADAVKASAQVKELEKKLADTEAKLIAAKEAATKANRYARPGDAIGAPNETKPMKAMADMMKNPAMKEMVKQQNLAQMDMIYGKLFQRFQLSDEEKQNIKALIADRMQLDVDLGLKMMGGDVTPEQRKALVEELTAAKKTSDEKIKTFLNNGDDYKTFQQWEDSKPERMQLTLGQAAFSAAGEPLTAQQEDQLVASMFSARSAMTDVPDMNKPENVTPGNLTQATVDKLTAAFDRQAQKVYADAAKYLSAKQLEALKTMQSQQRAMQETGLKMSQMMFGGQKK